MATGPKLKSSWSFKRGPSAPYGDELRVQVQFPRSQPDIWLDWWFGPVSGALSGAGAIASAEAVGQPTLVLNLTINGVAGAESFGTPVIATDVLLTNVGGIAGAEVLGQPSLSISLNASAIAGAEAFGTPTISTTALIVGAGNIPGAEAFGSASLVAILSPAGMLSAELFGNPNVAVVHAIDATGIVSAGAFGGPNVTVPYPVMPYGINSEGAFGTPVLTLVYIITGVVRNKQGQPVPGADVNLFNATTHILVHNGTSDSEGRYSVVVQDNTTDHFMVVFYGSNPRKAGCTLDNLRGK